MIWFNKWLRKASVILDAYVGVQLEWMGEDEVCEKDEKVRKAFELNSKASYWVRGNDFWIPFDGEIKGVLVLRNALWQDQNLILELMNFLRDFVRSGFLLDGSSLDMELSEWIRNKLEPAQAEVIDLSSYREMRRAGDQKEEHGGRVKEDFTQSVQFVVDSNSDKRREKALRIYNDHKSLAFVNWHDLSSLSLDWTNELGGVTIYIPEISSLSEDEVVDLKSKINLPTTVVKIILGFEDENQVKLWK